MAHFKHHRCRVRQVTKSTTRDFSGNIGQSTAAFWPGGKSLREQRYMGEDDNRSYKVN